MVQAEVRLVRQQHRLLALRQRGEDRGERHQVLAERDLESQPQPVLHVRLRGIDLHDPQAGRSADLRVVGPLPVLGHVHVRQGDQARQLVLDERRRLRVLQALRAVLRAGGPDPSGRGEHRAQMLGLAVVPGPGIAQGDGAAGRPVRPRPGEGGSPRGVVAHLQVQARRRPLGDLHRAVVAGQGHAVAQQGCVVGEELGGVGAGDAHRLTSGQQVGQDGGDGVRGGQQRHVHAPRRLPRLDGEEAACSRGTEVRAHLAADLRLRRQQQIPVGPLDVEPHARGRSPFDVLDDPRAHQLDARRARPVQQGPALGAAELVQPHRVPGGFHAELLLGPLQAHQAPQQIHLLGGELAQRPRVARAAVAERPPGQVPAHPAVAPVRAAQRPDPRREREPVADVLDLGRLHAEAREPETAEPRQQLDADPQRRRGRREIRDQRRQQLAPVPGTVGRRSGGHASHGGTGVGRTRTDGSLPR